MNRNFLSSLNLAKKLGENATILAGQFWTFCKFSILNFWMFKVVSSIIFRKRMFMVFRMIAFLSLGSLISEIA